ncbi:MAG: hypothetical protein QM776_00165 [Rhodocyclaceae bacterium]
MKTVILIGLILSLSSCSSIREWDKAHKEKEAAAMLHTLDSRYSIGQQSMGRPLPLSGFEIRRIPDSQNHIKFSAYKPDGSALFDKAEAICERWSEGTLKCELAGTEDAIALTEQKTLNFQLNATLEKYKFLFKIMIYRKGVLVEQHIYYANFAN